MGTHAKSASAYDPMAHQSHGKNQAANCPGVSNDYSRILDYNRTVPLISDINKGIYPYQPVAVSTPMQTMNLHWQQEETTPTRWWERWIPATYHLRIDTFAKRFSRFKGRIRSLWSEFLKRS